MCIRDRGYYVNDALYFLSDCYLRSDQRDDAIETLTTLAGQGTNQYTVTVLEKLSDMTFEDKRYDEAAAAYRQLYAAVSYTHLAVYKRQRQRRRAAHLGLIVLGVAFDVVDDVERLEYAFGPDLFGRKFARYADLEALGTQALLLHDHQGRHPRTFGRGIEQQGLGIHLPAVGTVFGHEFRICLLYTSRCV